MANFGTVNRIAVLGVDQIETGGIKYNKKRESIFLDAHPITPPNFKAKDAYLNKQVSKYEVVYNSLKPMVTVLKLMGMLPLSRVSAGIFKFKLISPIMVYCLGIFISIICYIFYLQYDEVVINRSSEGKFEEAAIDYLFITYLLPIIAVPIMWYETDRITAVFSLWSEFEKMYKNINGKALKLYNGTKPMLITIVLPLIASGAMIVIHMTMVNYKIFQIIPYCFINTITYIVGGYWYLKCLVIASVAESVSNEFQLALKNLGRSTKVAEYRSLWLRLNKITRDTGTAVCYTMIFLCLYLFMTITLSIYGLLSQIQSGLSLKDIGLAITAGLSTTLLFFVCDIGHFASMNVRDKFQKKLLLVELSWMNEDTQQEIAMFLRATEMNTTSLSLGGFFDVNRTLFKSLMATMVTYLVVLLQFQISIPDSGDSELVNTTISLTTMLPK